MVHDRDIIAIDVPKGVNVDGGPIEGFDGGQTGTPKVSSFSGVYQGGES